MINFDGISVALITPWREAGGIDVAALERIVAHVCNAGVVNVCPAGTTGEGPRLSREQRVEMVRRCASLVPKGVGIVGAVASLSIDETLAELDAQAAAGAGVALLTPPSRMPLNGDGCRDYFTRIAARTPLPIVLYHIPVLTGVHVPPELILELADHPSIVGLKDSSADIQYHARVLDGLAEAGNARFSVVTGADAMLTASLQAGGKGGILASANVVPAQSVALHRAVRAGDLKTALEISRRLFAVVLACRRGTLPSGWKAAVEILGLAPSLPVPPGEKLTAAQVETMRNDLRRLGVVP